jgi:uncharacterized protein YbjT (DUF2867 family)
MTTVLVTGATGTVGSALVPALQARGVKVRAMVRNPNRTVAGVENVVADLADAPTGCASSDVAYAAFNTRPPAEHAPQLNI